MNTRFVTVVFLFAICIAANGETYYVNNKSGRDENNGLSAEKAFATISRVLAGVR